jgi:RNA polymerase sigma-70 factor (ECF subfamily)
MLTALNSRASAPHRVHAVLGANRHGRDDVRTLFLRMLPRLRRLAYVLTGNLDRGDDLVQRACLNSSMNYRSVVEPVDDLDLIRAVKDIWLEELVAQCKHTGLRAAQAGPARRDCPQNRSMADGEGAAIVMLPRDQRLAVALVCVDGLTYQPADVLDIPVSSLSDDLLAGRRALQKAMIGGAV